MTERKSSGHPPVISDALAIELRQYLGKWVAIDNQHVVAAGNSVVEILAKAAEKGVDSPSTLHVPTHPELPRFLSPRTGA